MTCPARLRATWDEFPIDVQCERDGGHQGDHSAEDGEWAWVAIAPAQSGDVLDDLWWEAGK